MMNIQSLKERFECGTIPVKWGGIASDLLRLSSMAHANKLDSKTFQDVLMETKLFTEWLAPQVGFEQQETILSLQRTLSDISPAYLDAKDIEARTQAWSDKVLTISGLLTDQHR